MLKWGMDFNNEGTNNQSVRLAEKVEFEKQNLALRVAEQKAANFHKKEEERVSEFNVLTNESKGLSLQMEKFNLVVGGIEEQEVVLQDIEDKYLKNDEIIRSFLEDPWVINQGITKKSDFLEALNYQETEEIVTEKELVKRRAEITDKLSRERNELAKGLGVELTEGENVSKKVLDEAIAENKKVAIEKENLITNKKINLVVEQVDDWVEVNSDVKEEMVNVSNFIKDYLSTNGQAPTRLDISKTSSLIREKFGEEILEQSFDRLVTKIITAIDPGGKSEGVIINRIKNQVNMALVDEQITDLKSDYESANKEKRNLEKKSDDWIKGVFGNGQDNKRISYGDFLDLHLMNDDSISLDWTEDKVNSECSVSSRKENIRVLQSISESIERVERDRLDLSKRLLQLQETGKTGLFKRGYEVDGKKLNDREMEELKSNIEKEIGNKTSYIEDSTKRQEIFKGNLESKEKCLLLVKSKLEELYKKNPELFKEWLSGMGKVWKVSNKDSDGVVSLTKWNMTKLLESFDLEEGKIRGYNTIIDRYNALINKRKSFLI